MDADLEELPFNRQDSIRAPKLVEFLFGQVVVGNGDDC